MALLSVVISGDEDAVLVVEDVWRERGRKTKRLRVSHAFHSPRMDAMLGEFAEVAGGVSLFCRRGSRSSPTCAASSGLSRRSARRSTGSVMCVSRCVSPRGCAGCGTQGVSRFLELGPDGVLSAMVQNCLGEQETRAAGGCRGGNCCCAAATTVVVVCRMGIPVVAVPLLRGERPEIQALIRCFG